MIGIGLKPEATAQLQLSYSALDDWIRCPSYYLYKRVFGVVRTGESDLPALFGTAFHAADEAYAKGATIEQSIDMALSMYTPYYKPSEELRTPLKLRILLEEYFKYYAFDRQRYDWVGSEVEFSVDLTPDIMYRGIIDKVMTERSTGRMWFKDIKTTTSPTSFVANPNMQFTSYLHAGKTVYPEYDIAGMLVDIVAIRKNGPTARKDGKGWLQGQGPSDMFMRYPTQRTDDELNRCNTDIRTLAYMIHSCYQLEVWPQFTSNCRKYNRECPYKAVCIQPIESRGEILSSSLYQPRKERVAKTSNI